MPGLESSLRSLAQTFAADVVATLRTAKLDELVEATRTARSPHDAGSGNRASPPRGASAIQAALDETARMYRLSEREVSILALAVRAETRTATSKTLGIPENTLKTQARVLLRKLGSLSLSDAAIAVLHRALGSTAVSGSKKSR